MRGDPEGRTLQAYISGEFDAGNVMKKVRPEPEYPEIRPISKEPEDKGHTQLPFDW